MIAIRDEELQGLLAILDSDSKADEPLLRYRLSQRIRHRLHELGRDPDACSSPAWYVWIAEPLAPRRSGQIPVYTDWNCEAEFQLPDPTGRRAAQAAHAAARALRINAPDCFVAVTPADREPLPLNLKVH
jgi:hypothetical protein